MRVIKLDPVTATGQAVKETWDLCVGTLARDRPDDRRQRAAPRRSAAILRIASMSGQVAQDGFRDASVVSLLFCR